MKNFVDVITHKYATFSGRAARKEYWMFVLWNIIVAILISILDTAIGSTIPYWIYFLAIIIPSIALGVRRLHDTGHSGWWMFIGLIPLLGGLIILFWLIEDSAQGDNVYGPNPKGASEVIAQAPSSHVDPFMPPQPPIPPPSA